MPAGDALDAHPVRREFTVETSTVVPRPRGQQRQPDCAVEPVTETRQIPGDVVLRYLELLGELVDTEVATQMKVEQGVVLTPEGCRRIQDELDQFPVERERRIGEPLGIERRVAESLALLHIPSAPPRPPKHRVARNDKEPTSNVVRCPPLAKDFPRPVE